MTDARALLPCPFCGAEAERYDDHDTGSVNEGGSCITCKRCGASSPMHFERKENLISSWNDRVPSPPVNVGREIKCEADFYALWCDKCNDHPSNCKNKIASLPAAPAEGVRLREVLIAARPHVQEMSMRLPVGPCQRDICKTLDLIDAALSDLPVKGEALPANGMREASEQGVHGRVLAALDVVHQRLCKIDDLPMEAFEAFNMAQDAVLAAVSADNGTKSESVLAEADRLHDLGFQGGWNAAIEECEKIAKTAYSRMFPKPSNRITAENAGHVVAQDIRALKRPLSPPQSTKSEGV